MATGYAATRTTTDRDAMLRRVAIVLSSLPAPMAAKLLGTMDPDAKQTLRRTMTSLADVDPLERSRAIEAFKVSVRSQPPEMNPVTTQSYSTNSASHGSGTSVLKPSHLSDESQTHGDASSPLAFLNQVDEHDLAALLSEEHPQAIAIVLASIQPAKAGAVLPLLSESLRTITLSRIGRLGDIAPDTAQDLESHFRDRIERRGIRSQSERGKQKLDAILASMPSSTSSPTNSPQTASPDSQPNRNADPQETPTPRSVAPSRHSDAEVSAIDLSHRLRVVRDEPVDSGSNQQVAREAAQPSQTASVEAESAPASFSSTDEIHEHLRRLSPIELCQSLGKVDTRAAVLTLCGLPNPTAEAALALLPKDQAKMVRAQMASLNALNLRDIDNAKEDVAMASLSVDTVSQRRQAQASSQSTLLAA